MNTNPRTEDRDADGAVEMPKRIWTTHGRVWSGDAPPSAVEYVRADQVSALTVELEVMRGENARKDAALAIQDKALSEATVTFMAYAINHREKVPADQIKAERNDACADKCRDARVAARSALTIPSGEG